jgi:hypothetical protein
MAKHRSQKRRSHSKSKTARRSQQGGGLAGNPPSSWGWVNGTVGNGWTQFMNSLTLNPSQNAGTNQSNDVVPVNNINANDQQPMLNTNLGGGGRKKKSKGKKRGGSWMAVVNQALVPGTLLAAQQMYGSKNSNRKIYGNKKTIKNRSGSYVGGRR